MTGIETHHRKQCRSHEGRRCNCTPSYRAVIKHDGKLVRSRRYRSKDAAVAWRRDAQTALAAGLRPDGTGPKVTIAEHVDELLDGMRSGRILDRSGNVYRPATIRSYQQAADKYVKPKLGHMRVDAVRRRDIQDFVDDLREAGLAASTIHNKLDVLRVTFRRAIDREIVNTDPCQHLRLPAIRRKPRQVADPARAAVLLDALPDTERALWTTLFYAGLRISEARALRWSDIDFENGLHVRRGWDDVEGELEEPKTEAGVRIIPLTGRLKTELVLLELATGRGGDDLCFGRTPTLAFDRATARRRALKAWGWKDTRDERGKRIWVKAREDALDPLTPHEARHTCASYLIAAGVNDMQLQRYIGHTDVRTTKNIYGHLFPDDTQRVASALDAYLDEASRGNSVGTQRFPPSGS